MIFKLIIRNLLYKPLSTILSLILLLFGVAIISLLLTVQQQLERKFNTDLKDIDLVIGAKGSPLQLVLSAIFHADVPTGNIAEEEVNRIVHNPMIEQAIPLAYGDSYKGFTILGTDSDYVTKYNAVLKKGRLFNQPMEALLGANVAAAAHKDIDSTFFGTHGQSEKGHQHKDHLYKVVGVLQPTGSVIDNLVITNVETVREIHEHHHDEDTGAKANDEDEKENHKKEITAVLIKFRSPMGLMILPQMINETTNMQAASPTLEINRLLNLMGIGILTLQYIAAAIMIMAGLSVFISLFNRLNERRYEMALLRSYGYSRWQLFIIILSEGLILAVTGFICGIIISRLGLWMLNNYSSTEYHVQLQSLHFQPQEMWLLVISICIGLIASLFPAIKVFTLNISKTLANE